MYHNYYSRGHFNYTTILNLNLEYFNIRVTILEYYITILIRLIAVLYNNTQQTMFLLLLPNRFNNICIHSILHHVHCEYSAIECTVQ